MATRAFGYAYPDWQSRLVFPQPLKPRPSSSPQKHSSMVRNPGWGAQARRNEQVSIMGAKFWIGGSQFLVNVPWLLPFLTSRARMPYYGELCDRSRILLETPGGVAQWQ